MSLHVVHTVLQLGTGGQERFILNLSRELVARGHKVTVVSMTEGGDLRASFEQIPTVNVLRVPGGSRVSLFLRLAIMYRSLAPDVVHTHNATPLVYGVPAARAALVRRVVHTKHGSNPHMTPLALNAARVWVNGLTAFVSVSETTGEIAKERERPPKRLAHVVPNGVPLDQFTGDPAWRAGVRKELGIPQDAVVVGSVGRLADEKDYPLLVRSVAPLLNDKLHLVLVGDGDDRPRIEACVREQLTPERRSYVHLTGTRRDIPQLLASFDVFALSSWIEGLPLVIPEAMGSRLPIVATAVGGLPNVVKPAFGRLVPHGKDEAMRAAIAELVDSAALRKKLGEAAHREAHERYSLSAMTTAYERLYRIEPPPEHTGSDRVAR